MIQEDGALVAHDRALGQIAFQRVGGLPRQRHLPFFAAFAAHAQPALGAVDIVEVEPDQLADAHAAAVEQLEDGAVARRMRALQLARRDAVQQRVDLLGASCTSGSRLRRFGSAHQPRRC